MLVKNIHSKIHEIRNQKVMLDFDLATLYEIETRVLNQAVKRNIDRFPEDFMFQLTKAEFQTLMSQVVISKTETRGGTQKMPFAFSEQDVAMLSSVLKSKKAIEVNISIMRAFVVMKQYIVNYAELNKKIEELEAKYNKRFADVYEALNYLMGIKKVEDKQKTRTKIGYKTN